MSDAPSEIDCSSCGEECAPEGECPASKRPCGHHCDCSWSQDECCWCGKVFNFHIGRVLARDLRAAGPTDEERQAIDRLQDFRGSLADARLLIPLATRAERADAWAEFLVFASRVST